MKFKLLTFLCALVLSINAQIDSIDVTGTIIAASAVYVDNNDHIWLTGTAKLKYYDGTSWQTFTGPQYTVRHITQTLDGKVWKTGGGFQYFDGVNWNNPDLTGISSLISSGINDITADSSGNLWVACAGGFCKYDGVTWTDYSANSYNVNCIRYDVATNKIVAGYSSGITVYDGTNFTNYYLQAGVNELALSNGEIWARNANGLYLLHNGVFEDASWFSCYVDQPMYYPYPYVWSIFPGNNGAVRFNANPFVYDLNYSTTVTAVIPNPINYVPSDRIYYKGQRAYMYQGGTNKRIAIYDLNINSSTSPNEFRCNETVTGYGSAATTYLDVNNVKAMVINSADMFWDMNNNPRYEVPKGSGSYATFEGSIWMGGMVNGQVRTACQTYRQNGVDFWPGQLDTVSGINSYDSLYVGNMTKMSKYKIEEFKYHFANGDVQSGAFQPNYAFFKWPATDSANFSRLNAPFIDFNNDGHYNPMDGDYPDIMGDEMVYHVFNDASCLHTETGGNKLPLHVEVREKAYAYSCPGIADSMRALNYTTFYEFEIINRSDTTIDSMYIGFWNDVDLGYYNDDYVGCSVTDNAGYVYNGDNYDENGNGVVGYGTRLPCFSTAILKSPKAYNNDGIDNNHNGIVDETGEDLGMSAFVPYTNTFNNVNGNPTQQMAYYNYLRGKWMDGSSITYGDQGATSGSLPTTFMYPGDSDPYGYGVGGGPTNPNPQPDWSEIIAGNSPGDRRFLITSGPFVLQAKDTTKVVYSMVFTQDSSLINDNTGVIAKNLQDVRRIKNWYNANNFPSCVDLSTIGLKEQNINTIDATIYPNPGTGMVNIKVENEKNVQSVEVMDLLGNILVRSIIQMNGTLDFSGYSEGIYLIKVSSGLKQKTFKYIKQ